MMHVAFCSSEVVPFAKTGGMADVCGALPLALEKLGIRVSIFMPHYSAIGGHGPRVTRLNNSVSAANIGKDISVFLIENDHFFGRKGLYGDSHGDFQDNLDRFQFFCWKTLEVLKQLNLGVDIVHCHDWQTALIPVYLKLALNRDDFYAGMTSVLTIHNIAYQGVFPRDQYARIGLEERFFQPQAFEYFGQINLLKAGILHSDDITTVSPRYAQEIQTREFGAGLEGVLGSRKDRVTGILNGIDHGLWDPATDPLIEKNYSRADPSGKGQNKNLLQKRCGLAENPDIPLFVSVGRLAEQKGIELIHAGMRGLLKQRDIQLVLLGTGEARYHRMLQRLEDEFPEKVAVHLTFDEGLAHQIYAGGDIFLMPSAFEPCGLSQMISLRYGTIPLVHKTGGLADTVVPFNERGNGFVFSEYTVRGFQDTVQQAIAVFHDKPAFLRLMARAFDDHFSWDESARHYQTLYEQTGKDKGR